jgi:hypothetical protein
MMVANRMTKLKMEMTLTGMWGQHRVGTGDIR